jgi:hypothetical protein
MKTLEKGLLLIAMACFAFNLQAGSSDSLKLIGKLFNNDQQVKNGIIKIYQKNKLIKTLELERKNYFTTNIPLNTVVMVDISAPDLHTKRFVMDTHVPENLTRTPSYEFDMDIFSQKELEGVNTSMLDFPAGLVSYNPKKKAFERDKAYTNRMKKRYTELLEEAMMSERATME